VLVHDLLIGRHSGLGVVEVEVVDKVVLSIHRLGEIALDVDLLARLAHSGRHFVVRCEE
jgi:hypothetical protein